MEQYFRDIESYVLGELTDQKLTNFEVALVSDASLQAAVLEHRDMLRRLEGIRLRDEVKKNMVSPIPRRFNRSGMSVLILLIGSVGVFVYWYWTAKLKEPAKPINSFPVIQQLPIVDQSNPATSETLPKKPILPKEMEEVITGDKKTLLAFNDAINKLTAVEVTTMGDGVKDTAIELQLNRAIRLLRNKKPYQVDSLLQKVIQKNNPLYQEDAEWLNALGWLLRDPGKGKQLLRQIEDKPTHAYRRNAIRLLGQL
jgi:hypothetical protein